jgi:pyruvate formate lyase activating enzyme
MSSRVHPLQCQEPQGITETGTTGTVFNIQRFSLHDGPGIRTTVFLKGCPLRCRWCHNPESQSPRPELAFVADRCIGCGACVAACPNGAVSMVDGRPLTDRTVCEAAGACVDVCPAGARSLLGREMTLDGLAREVEKDTPFFEESGGGVTFSGGEPLMQPRFVAEALDVFRRREIHTAVDTCGYAPSSVALDVLSRADLVLYDLKTMDPVRHEEWTGVGNDLILSNLEMLARAGVPLRLRVPLVPGVNDGESEIAALGAFASSLKGSPAVNVLPYHAIGMDKNVRLGRAVPDIAVNGSARDRAAAVAATLAEYGLDVRVGG